MDELRGCGEGVRYRRAVGLKLLENDLPWSLVADVCSKIEMHLHVLLNESEFAKLLHVMIDLLAWKRKSDQWDNRVSSSALQLTLIMSVLLSVYSKMV